MMQKVFSVILLLMATVAVVDAAHITDKLLTGLYEKPDAAAKPFRLLASGEPLDVLKQEDGFSEVRLSDNTTGWVESSYITEEKPANAMLLEAQAEMTLLKQELAGARRKLRQLEAGALSRAVISPAEDQHAGQQQTVSADGQVAALAATKQLELRLQELQQRMQDAAELLATDTPATTEKRGKLTPAPGNYLTWGLIVFGLILAFVAGMALVDYRNRKRHGGFRI